MVRIAAAGHLCIDFSPAIDGPVELTPGQLVEVGPLSMTLGGSVANTGSALAALGAEVAAFAGVGDDRLGELLLDELATTDFDVSGIDTIPGASTSYSIVMEDPGTDRTFWHHTGANSDFDGSRIEFDGLDVFHLGYPPLLPALLPNNAQALTEVLARARAAGSVTSIDLAVVDPASPAASADWSSILTTMAPHTDVVSPSLDDLTSALHISAEFSVPVIDRLADMLLTAGAAIVAISAGAHGLFIRTSDQSRLAASGHSLTVLGSSWSDVRLHVPALDVIETVTTNGAGDASTAGLVFGLATGASIEDSALIATACSAAIIQGRRPTPSVIIELIPSLASIFEFRAA